MRAPVVVDTGALYALINRSDSWHQPVLDWWSEAPDRAVIPAVTLPEVCYLLNTRMSELAELHFVRIVAKGEFDVDYDTDLDLPRAAELMAKYQNFPIGFVDAAVIALAERLETRTICTTDRRHFGAIRDRKGRPFTLVP